MPEYYYHLTDEEHLGDILRQGLVPMSGRNCESVLDTRAAVFLCRVQDVAYWQILLGKPILLSVRGITPDAEYKYACYEEMLHYGPIGPEKISVETKDASNWATDATMANLCKNYIAGISYFTEMCAAYYNNVWHNVTVDDIVAEAKSITAVLPRLNYGVRPMPEWKEIMKGFGEEGEYTFCDNYYETDKKLWQKLGEYPEDKSRSEQLEIRRFIEETFPFADVLDTGGYNDFRTPNPV